MMNRRSFLLLAVIVSLPALPARMAPGVGSARAQGGSTLGQDLQAALDKNRATSRIQGISAAIIMPGLPTWLGVSGLSNRATSQPISPELIFSVGSITKTFMAALMLQLAEEGRLTLDHTIAMWLPELPPNVGRQINGAITLRQLLNHTSGIYDYTDSNAWVNALLADLARVWTPEEILQYVGSPYFAPGRGWHYSNTNYILLGIIAQKAANAPIEKELRRRFFTPLNLSRTFLEVREVVLGEVAHGHFDFNGDGIADDISNFPRTALYSAAWTGGAIVSTAEDIAKWANALYGGQILSPESLQQMLTFVSAGQAGYGLGVGRFLDPTLGEIWFHDGEIPGYESLMFYLPKDHVSAVLLANEDPVDLGPTMVALLNVLRNARPRAAVEDSTPMRGSYLFDHEFLSSRKL